MDTGEEISPIIDVSLGFFFFFFGLMNVREQRLVQSVQVPHCDYLVPLSSCYKELNIYYVLFAYVWIK